MQAILSEQKEFKSNLLQFYQESFKLKIIIVSPEPPTRD